MWKKLSSRSSSSSLGGFVHILVSFIQILICVLSHRVYLLTVAEGMPMTKADRITINKRTSLADTLGMSFIMNSDQGMDIAGPIIKPSRFNNTYTKPSPKYCRCPKLGNDQQANSSSHN